MIFEIKEYLGMPQDSYTIVTHFKTHVLEKNLAIINSETDIKVSIKEPIKKSRRIEGYIFKIDPNEQVSGTVEEIEKTSTTKITENQRQTVLLAAAKKVKGTGVTEEEYMQGCYDYTVQNDATDKGFYKYLIKTIENDWGKMLPRIENKDKKMTHKTGFHLSKSRGENYTNEDLEKILLGRKKKTNSITKITVFEEQEFNRDDNA